jgi:hypothetical protein
MADITETLSRKPQRRFLQSEVAISRILTYLTSIPDPDLLLQKAGISRYQLRQLELDDEVCQAKDTRVEAVVSAPWRLEPNQTRVGKLLTSLIEPHVETLKRGVMDARFYGYSVLEIIYQKVAKGIGLDRLSIKPIQWFEPQRDGSLVFFPDDGSGGMEGIPCNPIKFLLTTCNASYENPFGEAILSRLWFPVTWRREGWGLWLQFLETFGEPIILGAVANYEEFVEAMTAQGVRSTVAWQSVTGDDKIETITASTPGEFERLENAILKRVQKLILGQTLTSDIGSHGSYAVAAIHNEVRNDKRRADLRMVQAAGQKLVNNLALINGIDPPRFVMADDAGLEMTRAQRDSVLIGVLQNSGLQLTREYFLRSYDYSEDDLQEIEEDDKMEDETEDEVVDEMEDGEPTGTPSTNETSELPPAVKDRSVADED